eukprot:TRINITY_DN2833_c0_g1_i22.p1 TRINITY_DN2833_c0_g1~~TRINITY_DN2833_c0_g1_i22.p1  ORF type:complete len:329 (-),score=38.51 TRINITY_DN2833_c0_g1_i22:252-1238(-)
MVLFSPRSIYIAPDLIKFLALQTKERMIWRLSLSTHQDKSKYLHGLRRGQSSLQHCLSRCQPCLFMLLIWEDARIRTPLCQICSSAAVVLNKCDVGDAEKVKVWMEDYEKYLEALEGDQRYLSCLSRSMCLVLDEFYKNLNAVAVSSVSGFGFDKLDEAIAKARKEYFDVFLPDLIANKSKNTSAEEIEKMNEEIKKFEEQLNKDKEIKESTPPATGSAPSLIVDSSRAQRFEMQFDEENKNIPSKKSDISKKSEEKLKKDGEGGDVKQVEKMMDELEIKSTKNDAIQSISRILWMGLFWIEETLFLQRHPKTHLSQYCFFIGFLQDT